MKIMPKHKKISFIIIVVLLVILIPLTILGFIGRKVNARLLDNPNHDLYYKGHIWFYDNDGNFKSKYECINEKCEISKTIINDDEYDINYYKDGKSRDTKIISDKYVFITDGEEIELFDISIGNVITKYKSIKNYYTNLNDTYIIQNANNKWGVLNFVGTLKSILPFEYDFIGLIDEAVAEVNLDKFIVEKDNKWQIINNQKSHVSGSFDEIITYYNDQYIFLKNDNNIFKIIDYQDNEYLKDYVITKYYIVDKYTAIISNNNLYIFENLNNNYIKSVPITNSDNLILELNNNKLTIKNNDNIIQVVEL